MHMKSFFDKATYTLTYVVYDEISRDAVIIDPVLDFDPASGKVATSSADEVLRFVRSASLKVHLILETHAHADHLSSSQFLKAALPGAKVAIGAHISQVQAVFKKIYNLPATFKADGSQFDLLLTEGQEVKVGTLRFAVINTPGHTPACASYLFDGSIFVGDTLFMPDYGTGRADFPGGSASDLYDSISGKLFKLPEETRVFTGHDYQPGGRPLAFESTMGDQKRHNIQLNGTTTKEAFIRFREARDASLAAPRLLHPSVQVNIDGAHLPQPESNGRSYLKMPLTLPQGLKA